MGKIQTRRYRVTRDFPNPHYREWYKEMDGYPGINPWQPTIPKGATFEMSSKRTRQVEWLFVSFLDDEGEPCGHETTIRADRYLKRNGAGEFIRANTLVEALLNNSEPLEKS